MAEVKESIVETDTVLVWRFLAADHRLSRAFEADQRLGGRPTPPISPINAGDVLHGRDWRESSLLGLHGWQKMSDALHYGRGMVVARLRLSSEIRYQRRYRIEATEASVLWLTLHTSLTTLPCSLLNGNYSGSGQRDVNRILAYGAPLPTTSMARRHSHGRRVAWSNAGNDGNDKGKRTTVAQ